RFSVLRILATNAVISLIFVFKTTCLTFKILDEYIENLRKPMPKSNLVKRTSPANSPQIDTGTPLRLLLLIICDSNFSTAGCNGLYKYVTDSSLRSIASKY